MAEGSYLHLPDARPATPAAPTPQPVEPAVWRALDAVADKAGLSASALAKEAGLDSTTFNKSKRVTPEGQHRSPSMRSVFAACRVAGLSMAEFGTMVDQEMGEAQ